VLSLGGWRPSAKIFQGAEEDDSKKGKGGIISDGRQVALRGARVSGKKKVRAALRELGGD